MLETAGHGTKTNFCDVDGCNNEAERSISGRQVVKCDLKIKAGGHRSIHLCKEHYKQYKKQTKESRELNSIY